MDIREAVIQLINVKKHQKLIDDFARSKYNERFPYSRRIGSFNQGWNSYKGFEIISEFEIRVKYEYGTGDMEYDDSFIVNISPEIRDSKIDQILK